MEYESDSKTHLNETIYTLRISSLKSVGTTTFYFDGKVSRINCGRMKRSVLLDALYLPSTHESSNGIRAGQLINSDESRVAPLNINSQKRKTATIIFDYSLNVSSTLSLAGEHSSPGRQERLSHNLKYYSN